MLLHIVCFIDAGICSIFIVSAEQAYFNGILIVCHTIIYKYQFLFTVSTVIVSVIIIYLQSLIIVI